MEQNKSQDNTSVAHSANSLRMAAATAGELIIAWEASLKGIHDVVASENEVLQNKSDPMNSLL